MWQLFGQLLETFVLLLCSNIWTPCARALPPAGSEDNFPDA